MIHVEIRQNTTGTEEININTLNKMYELAYEDQQNNIQSQLDETSIFQGRLHSQKGHQSKVDYLMNKYNNLFINIDISYIAFADPTIESILLNNNIGDGQGVSITNASSVTTFPNAIFKDSQITQFNELTYFSNLTGISQDCFRNCTSLQNIDLSLFAGSSIGHSAFAYCTTLRSFNKETFSTITNIYSNVFCRCENLEGELHFPNLTTLAVRDYGCWFVKCKKVTKITLGHITNLISGSKNNTVERSGFSNCFALRTVDLGDSIQHIGQYNFLDDTSLQSIIIRTNTPPKLASANSSNQIVETSDVSSISASNIWLGPATCKIFVPDVAVQTYQQDELFSKFSTRIAPISDYETGVTNGDYI